MSKLPTPQRQYDADVAWSEHHPGDVRLFFAKRDRDQPDKLHSRLEIRYAPESLLGHFWRNSREFHSKLREFADQWPRDAERDDLRPEAMKAEKSHSEWANFESMAHAGTEAVLDFYTLPPSGIAMFVRGQGAHGLNLSPIVRVQMTSFELLRLLDGLESVVNAVRAYIPAGFERIAEPVKQEAV